MMSCLTSAFLSLILFTFFSAVHSATTSHNNNCRNQPGDPGFPSAQTLQQFNTSIGGQLLNVVPSGEFCQEIGGCSDELWNDDAFRRSIPGAMLSVSGLGYAKWRENFQRFMTIPLALA